MDLERCLAVLEAECRRVRGRRSCLLVHGRYVAQLLAGVKTLELRRRALPAPLEEVYLMSTGSGCSVHGVVDFLGPSSRLGGAELREPACAARHRVPEEALAAYLSGGAPHLHAIPVGNPRVFRAPVRLGAKKGVRVMRSLEPHELELLRAAPLATRQEAAVLLAELGEGRELRAKAAADRKGVRARVARIKTGITSPMRSAACRIH
jgi:predicted transcriptional regulator